MKNVAEKLVEIVGSNWVITSPQVIEAYIYDKTEPYVRPQPSKEVIVVKPSSAKEISEILKVANVERIPVHIRGGGTGLTGGAVPTKAGIIISLERMNRIQIQRENMVAIAEAGATLKKLIDEAQKYDLYYPPHPGDESAQIGGLIATNAGGSRALKHGSIRSTVLGLEVVLPTGEIVVFGGPTLKNNLFTNYMHFFIGSEGILGILTRAWIRLFPKSGHSVTLVYPYCSYEDAITSAKELLFRGFVPLSLEILDRKSAEVSAKYNGTSWPIKKGDYFLILVFAEPSDSMLYAEIEESASILSKRTCDEPVIAEREDEQQLILKIRSDVYSAMEKFVYEGLDVSVPLGAIEKFVEGMNEISKSFGIELPLIGHLGDGTFHPDIIMKEGLRKEDYDLIREKIYELVISLEGTITGEHGIGFTRRKYVPKLLKDEEISVIRRLKMALDPNGILNPDKVLP